MIVDEIRKVPFTLQSMGLNILHLYLVLITYIFMHSLSLFINQLHCVFSLNIISKQIKLDKTHTHMHTHQVCNFFLYIYSIIANTYFVNIRAPPSCW